MRRLAFTTTIQEEFIPCKEGGSEDPDFINIKVETIRGSRVYYEKFVWENGVTGMPVSEVIDMLKNRLIYKIKP